MTYQWKRWLNRLRPTVVTLALSVFSSTTAYAVETVDYRLSAEDIGPIKQAIGVLVPSGRAGSLSIVRAQGRQGIDRTVYVCGLVGGFGTDDANLLFFAERREAGYVAQAIDLDVEASGAARARCEQYGFHPPKPHYTVALETLPKNPSPPPVCSYLCEALDPDDL